MGSNHIYIYLYKHCQLQVQSLPKMAMLIDSCNWKRKWCNIDGQKHQFHILHHQNKEGDIGHIGAFIHYHNVFIEMEPTIVFSKPNKDQHNTPSQLSIEC